MPRIRNWKELVLYRPDQGNSANPNTGQIGPTFEEYFGLSVPTISLADHAANHVMLL